MIRCENITCCQAYTTCNGSQYRPICVLLTGDVAVARQCMCAATLKIKGRFRRRAGLTSDKLAGHVGLKIYR